MVRIGLYFCFGHCLCRMGCNGNLPVASGNCSSDCTIPLLQNGRCVDDLRDVSTGCPGNHIVSNPGGDCRRRRNRSVKSTPRSSSWLCGIQWKRSHYNGSFFSYYKSVYIIVSSYYIQFWFLIIYGLQL